MVYLENIVRNGDLISCDYYREVDYKNKETINPFKMVYNFVTDTIEHLSEDHVSGYAYHAKQKLSRLARMEEIPSSAKEMWY